MKNLKNTFYAVFASLVLALVLPPAAFGATVKVTVNEIPITNVQIAQRAELLKLEPGPQGVDRRRIENAGGNAAQHVAD